MSGSQERPIRTSRQVVLSDLSKKLLQELRTPGRLPVVVVGELPELTEKVVASSIDDALPILDRLLDEGYQGLELVGALYYLAFRRMIDPFQRGNSTAAAFVQREIWNKRLKAESKW